MANPTAQGGFTAVGNITGGPGRIERYSAPASYATAIGRGDLTLITGAVSTPTDFGGGKGLAVVNQAAASDVPNGATITHRAASILASVFVETDPNTLYEARVNGGANAIAVADSQLNADWVTGVMNADTGLSLYMIDGTTEATTNTLGLKLLRPIPYAGDDDTLAQPRWLVRLNRHRYVDQIAGV